jgi:hypothetical protein
MNTPAYETFETKWPVITVQLDRKTRGGGRVIVATDDPNAFARQAIDALDSGAFDVVTALEIHRTMAGMVPAVWVYRHRGVTCCTEAGRANDRFARPGTEDEVHMLTQAHRRAFLIADTDR